MKTIDKLKRVLENAALPLLCIQLIYVMTPKEAKPITAIIGGSFLLLQGTYFLITKKEMLAYNQIISFNEYPKSYIGMSLIYYLVGGFLLASSMQ